MGSIFILKIVNCDADEMHRNIEMHPPLTSPVKLMCVTLSTAFYNTHGET